MPYFPPAPAGGSGTVTSVAFTVPGVLFAVSGSPVTTSGTLALSLLTQTANTVFAGPASGSAATPTMRALVAADVPNLDWAKITSGKPTTATGYGIALVAADIPAVLGGTTFSTSSGTPLAALRADAGTTTTPNVLAVQHTTSGVPAAGFGASTQFQAYDAAGTLQAQATLTASWVVATSATRQARLTLNVLDYGAQREVIRIEGSGTAGQLGFFGGSAAGKQTVTGSRGSNAALTSLLSALAAYGIITDSST